MSSYKVRRERRMLKTLLALERRDHARQEDLWRHALALSESERHNETWVKYARWDYTSTKAIASISRGEGQMETLGYSAVFAPEFDHAFLIDDRTIGTDAPWRQTRFREDAMYALMKHLRVSDCVEWTERKDRQGNTVMGATLLVARISPPKKDYSLTTDDGTLSLHSSPEHQCVREEHR